MKNVFALLSLTVLLSVCAFAQNKPVVAGDWVLVKPVATSKLTGPLVVLTVSPMSKTALVQSSTTCDVELIPVHTLKIAGKSKVRSSVYGCETQAVKGFSALINLDLSQRLLESATNRVWAETEHQSHLHTSFARFKEQ